MIEYGLLALASNSSAMFFDLSEMLSGIYLELKDNFYQNPSIMIAIGVFAIVCYVVVWK